MTIRTPVSNISQFGRSTRGVQLMNLAAGDYLVSMALLAEERRLEREKALEAESSELTSEIPEDAQQSTLPFESDQPESE
jgi:DNA gyrase/topoisomerase IV subunit A